MTNNHPTTLNSHNNIPCGCVLLETSLGDIVIDLPISNKEEQLMVYNFMQLCYIRYYTNTLIHTVIPHRFIQFGCPKGDGTGGTCIYGILDDTVQHDYYRSSKRFLKSQNVGRSLSSQEKQEKGHVIATCINGIPDTIGSQFIITTASGSDRALDGYISKPTQNQQQHTDNDAIVMDHSLLFRKFGIVVEDNNHILEQMNNSNQIFLDDNNRPYTDIRLRRAIVIYDPFIVSTIDYGLIRIDSEKISRYMMQQKGIQWDDDCDNVTYSPNDDRPHEEIVPKRISIEEVKKHSSSSQHNDDDDDDANIQLEHVEEKMIQENDMKSSAMVLEMLGDIPDAEITAPKNVLFVCQLNAITQSDDLQLIFSRFDEHVHVDLIRDYVTGASLQYAFITFTTNQQAEEAYLKMNRVLIDDRRIHVDFSQSVATLWDRYHQKYKIMPKLDENTGNHNRTMNRNPNNIKKIDRHDRKQQQSQDHKTNNNNHNKSSASNIGHYQHREHNDRRKHERNDSSNRKASYRHNDNDRYRDDDDRKSEKTSSRKLQEDDDDDDRRRSSYCQDRSSSRRPLDSNRSHIDQQYHDPRQLGNSNQCYDEYDDFGRIRNHGRNRRTAPYEEDEKQQRRRGDYHSNDRDYDDKRRNAMRSNVRNDDDNDRSKRKGYTNDTSHRQKYDDNNNNNRTNRDDYHDPNSSTTRKRSRREPFRRKERRYKEGINDGSSGEDSYQYNKIRYNSNKRRKLDTDHKDDDDDHPMSDDHDHRDDRKHTNRNIERSRTDHDDDDSHRRSRRHHKSSSRHDRKKSSDSDDDDDPKTKKEKKKTKKSSRKKKSKKKKHSRYDEDDDRRNVSKTKYKQKRRHDSDVDDDDTMDSNDSGSTNTNSMDDDSSRS